MAQVVTPEERWQRAKGFLERAEQEIETRDRLRNQMPRDVTTMFNAMVLADAVSSTKEILHGFISFTNGTHYEDNPDYPVLIQECEFAGLDLQNRAEELAKLNKLRNRRIHRDPGWIVTRDQARAAIQIAHDVDDLVKSAIAGKVAAAPHAMERKSEVQRAAQSGVSVDTGANENTGTQPRIPVVPGTPRLKPNSRLVVTSWVRYLAAAVVLLLVGATAGVLARSPAIGSPLALRIPATSSATATEEPMPYVLDGSLLITRPACESHEAALQVLNSATSSVRFMVGSPDSDAAMFALTLQSAGKPTLSGVVPASGKITVYVVAGPSNGAYHIDVLAPAGTVQLAASAC